MNLTSIGLFSGEKVSIESLFGKNSVINKNDVQQDKNVSTLPFADILASAIDNANATQAQVESESIKVATGEVDNLADLTIASTKATLAISLLAQIRDRAVNSYETIMRMTV